MFSLSISRACFPRKRKREEKRRGKSTEKISEGGGMTTPLRLMLPLTTTTTTAATFTSIFSYSSSKSTIFFQSPSPSLSSPNPNPFNPFPSHYSSSSPQSHRRCVPEKGSSLSSRHKWICGYMRKDQDRDSCRDEEENTMRIFGSDEEVASRVPTQAQSVVEGSGAVLVSEFKPVPDVDYLQELLAIQQQGPRAIGFFGTRNMGFTHQELIEILSYAMVITKNHIFTSGASGTNAAVIRGALRAEKPELLTVILPQSLKMQPPESQELLSKVKNVIEKPYNDHLPLIEASRLCNMDIISHVQQVICFAFHDSKLLMETCQEAKNLRKIVTLFYLD